MNCVKDKNVPLKLASERALLHILKLREGEEMLEVRRKRKKEKRKDKDRNKKRKREKEKKEKKRKEKEKKKKEKKKREKEKKHNTQNQGIFEEWRPKCPQSLG